MVCILSQFSIDAVYSIQFLDTIGINLINFNENILIKIVIQIIK